MKALTLTAPYGTLIAVGVKDIETRSWATSYRGPLAIHQAQGLGPVGGKEGLIDLLLTEPFRRVLSPRNYMSLVDFPRGCIVAVCELYDCRPTTDEAALSKRGWHSALLNTHWDLSDQERAFGDYTPGRFAWLLADIRALPTPIPARGQLGLWDWQPPEGFEL